MLELVAIGMFLLERGELLLSRDTDLGVVDLKLDQGCQQWEGGHTAAHLGDVEVELLYRRHVAHQTTRFESGKCTERGSRGWGGIWKVRADLQLRQGATGTGVGQSRYARVANLVAAEPEHLYSRCIAY